MFKDMRVSRAGRMAGGLIDSKLDDCHLRTTVTPFQVKIKIFGLRSLIVTNNDNLFLDACL